LRVIAGKGVIPYLNMAFILEVIQHNFNFLETFSFKKKKACSLQELSAVQSSLYV
jgi:hypothetical protein